MFCIFIPPSLSALTSLSHLILLQLIKLNYLSYYAVISVNELRRVCTQAVTLIKTINQNEYLNICCILLTNMNKS